MAKTVELTFDLMSTDYDRGFGSMVRHTITTRREMRSLEAGGNILIEGSLSVSGIDLNLDQKIKAVLTIED